MTLERLHCYAVNQGDGARSLIVFGSRADFEGYRVSVKDIQKTKITKQYLNTFFSQFTIIESKWILKP